MFRTAVAVSFAVAALATAAPGPKDESKPLPPITAEMKTKAVNNMKHIGLAMHNYHDTFGALPTNAKLKDGKPGLSWRVAILPFVEEDLVYKQFKLDEPWDSETNMKAAATLPKIYTPQRGKAKPGETFLQMPASKHGLLGEPGAGIKFQGVTDGLSNTIMAFEAAKPVFWTKPDDVEFDGKTLPKLGGSFDGDFHVVMGDGSVLRIPAKTDAQAIIDALGRQDGMISTLPDAIKKASK